MFYRSDHPCLEVSGQSPDLWMLVYRLAGVWDRSQIGLSRHVSVRYILKRSLNIDRTSTSPRSKSSCTIPRRWVPMAVGRVPSNDRGGRPCHPWNSIAALQGWNATERHSPFGPEGRPKPKPNKLSWKWRAISWSAISVELTKRFSQLLLLLFCHLIQWRLWSGIQYPPLL